MYDSETTFETVKESLLVDVQANTVSSNTVLEMSLEPVHKQC